MTNAQRPGQLIRSRRIIRKNRWVSDGCRRRTNNDLVIRLERIERLLAAIAKLQNQIIESRVTAGRNDDAKMVLGYLLLYGAVLVISTVISLIINNGELHVNFNYLLLSVVLLVFGLSLKILSRFK